MASSDPISTKAQTQLETVTWLTTGLMLLSLVIFVSFTWLPNSYHRMVGWPWILVWQLAFISIGATGILLLRKFEVVFRPLGYGLDKPAIALLLVACLSSLFAPFKAVAVWNLSFAVFYLVGLYSLHNLLGHKVLSLQNLWQVLTMVAGVTSLISLAYWRPSPEMWLSTNFYEALRNRFPFGHHNFTGGYLLLVVPIMIAFAIAHRGWRRWLAAMVSATGLIALYASGSRGAWLGAIVVILTTLVCWLGQSRGRQRRYLMASSLIVLCLIGGFLISNPRIRAMFDVRSLGGRSGASIELADGPTKDRLLMFKTASNIMKDRPLLGVGPGNMARVYNLYRPLEIGTGLDTTQQLHNMYLHILGELGIFGFAVYIWLIGVLVSQLRRLFQTVTDSKDRILLYGISASLLGYGASSLTDYQLENIGIASTLLILTTLIIGLADQSASAKQLPAALTVRPRRLLSLVVLIFICASFQLWARSDVGVYLAHAAQQDIQAQRFVDADAKLLKAAKLVPWDPTYHLLATEQLIKFREAAESATDKRAITEQAIDNLTQASGVAPNDIWLRHNLAVLALDVDPALAVQEAGYAVQLLPRSPGYTYYTLGLAYLNQGDTAKATTALALESLANPDFLIADLWSTEPLAGLLPDVLQKFFEAAQLMLTQTPKDSDAYRWMNDRMAVLSWWHQRPIDTLDEEALSPTIRAIIATDQSTDLALEEVDIALKAEPENASLQLFQAWLSPEQHLERYLKTAVLSEQEQDLLVKHIKSDRNLHTWINSVLQVVPSRFRYAVSLAYRNEISNTVVIILRPSIIRVSLFSELMVLFPEPPREFLQLDTVMEDMRAQQLGLPHPTHNQFQLSQT